jgi:hypothetical protein
MVGNLRAFPANVLRSYNINLIALFFSGSINEVQEQEPKLSMNLCLIQKRFSVGSLEVCYSQIKSADET